jgi:hypothetical protein
MFRRWKNETLFTLDVGLKRELTVKYPTQAANLTGEEDLDTINIETVPAVVIYDGASAKCQG